MDAIHGELAKRRHSAKQTWKGALLRAADYFTAPRFTSVKEVTLNDRARD